MKTRTLGVVLFGMLSSLLLAEEIELSDGRKFVDASISSESALRVVIKHKGGLTGVNKELLPPALAAKYPLKPELAVEEARREQAAKIARTKQDIELRQRARAQAEANKRQVLEEEAQARAAEALRTKAITVGAGLVGNYFAKRYDAASGEIPNTKVQLQELIMIGDSPNHWRLKGSVVVRVTRDISVNGNSAERAQAQADAKSMGPRELRQRRAETEFVRNDTYGFEADLNDLDGTPTISVSAR